MQRQQITAVWSRFSTWRHLGSEEVADWIVSIRQSPLACRWKLWFSHPRRQKSWWWQNTIVQCRTGVKRLSLWHFIIKDVVVEISWKCAQQVTAGPRLPIYVAVKTFDWFVGNIQRKQETDKQERNTQLWKRFAKHHFVISLFGTSKSSNFTSSFLFDDQTCRFYCRGRISGWRNSDAEREPVARGTWRSFWREEI